MSQTPNDIYDEVDLPEDTGEIVVTYYLLGKRPVKVTYVDGFPELVQTPDFDTKEFIIDIKTLHRINDAQDARKITEQEFRNACLAIGVKPI